MARKSRMDAVGIGEQIASVLAEKHAAGEEFTGWMVVLDRADGPDDDRVKVHAEMKASLGYVLLVERSNPANPFFPTYDLATDIHSRAAIALHRASIETQFASGVEVHPLGTTIRVEDFTEESEEGAQGETEEE